MTVRSGHPSGRPSAPNSTVGYDEDETQPGPDPAKQKRRFGRRLLIGGGAAVVVGGGAAVAGRSVSAPRGNPPPALPKESYGPVGITDLDALRAMIGNPKGLLGRIPADVTLVPWPSASPGGASLNEVAATLNERELLVLPEATEPYLVDSSKGFQRFRADAPWGETTEAELWDEMTRLPVGLVGMGPGTRLETSDELVQPGSAAQVRRWLFHQGDRGVPGAGLLRQSGGHRPRLRRHGLPLLRLRPVLPRQLLRAALACSARTAASATARAARPGRWVAAATGWSSGTVRSTAATAPASGSGPPRS